MPRKNIRAEVHITIENANGGQIILPLLSAYNRQRMANPEIFRLALNLIGTT
jgi:hypothetical protein